MAAAQQVSTCDEPNQRFVPYVLGGWGRLADAKDILTQFWATYRHIFPNHQLWKDFDAGTKTPCRCIPLLLHGDEGTTVKKGGVLVLSLQGFFGFGTSKRCGEEDRQGSLGEGIRLNFLRAGMQTRILILVCRKDCLGDKQVSKHIQPYMHVYTHGSLQRGIV